MTPIVIEYKCKFCGHSRAFENKDERGNAIDIPVTFDTQKWVSMLACDRCADFQRKRSDIIGWAVKQAMTLITYRAAGVNGARKPEVENKVREKLERITKAYARTVCTHYGVTPNWEGEFVDQLLESPEKTIQIMNWYSRNVTRYQKQLTSAPMADA